MLWTGRNDVRRQAAFGGLAEVPCRLFPDVCRVLATLRILGVRLERRRERCRRPPSRCGWASCRSCFPMPGPPAVGAARRTPHASRTRRTPYAARCVRAPHCPHSGEAGPRTPHAATRLTIGTTRIAFSMRHRASEQECECRFPPMYVYEWLDSDLGRRTPPSVTMDPMWRERGAAAWSRHAASVPFGR